MERIVSGESGFFLSEAALKSSYETFFKTIESKQRKWDIFILINRKGYWDYKIFFPDGVIDKSETQKIISDRYLEKISWEELGSLLQGRTVIIYDDSLTNGSNLFYYFLLCKKAEAFDVIPVVYALNSSFPSEKSRVLMERETKRIPDSELWTCEEKDAFIAEFIEKLKFRLLLNYCESERMSRQQTVLFQKNVSPLVMDLPMLNRIHGSCAKKIILTVEQLEKLKQSVTGRWMFIENIYRGLERPVIASYFRYEDVILEQVFTDLFHDFVVKCKYEKCERDEKYVQVSFTPFAIARSTTFESIYECFRLLYNGTPYAAEVFKNFSQDDFINRKMKEDGNICNALFRAVIYRVSGYIGKKFQQYVKEVLGVELEFDWKIMEDNFDDAFIETQKKWDQSFNQKLFQNLLLQCHNDGRIQPIAKEKIENIVKQTATQEKIDSYIRKRVIEKKKDIEQSLFERIYTFETIEYELDRHFSFKNKKERKTITTNTCLKFLETNTFSNFILVDGGEHIIYRGFRPGENSEILLHENLWFFYIYLYAYYDNVTENLKEGYQSFMQQLESFFRKREYMGNWITEDGFYFLRDYFGSMNSEEELIEEIAKRRYLVENSENGVDSSVQAGFIHEAVCIVQHWRKA